jgi:hypothetical protein
MNCNLLLLYSQKNLFYGGLLVIFLQKCIFQQAHDRGREVYLKKDNVKCEEDAGISTNPSVHLHALVIGCSYKGSTVVLVKETYCRYKIQLGTGIGRYF